MIKYTKYWEYYENIEDNRKWGGFGPYIQFGKENVSIPKGREKQKDLLENAKAKVKEKSAQKNTNKK